MKKIIFILLLLVLSMIGFSQGINKVFRSSYSKYDGEQWVEKNSMYPESLYITIKNKDIWINNETESHFVMFGDSEKTDYDTHSCYSWRCIDDEGKYCLFLIKIFRSDDMMSMSFVYSSDKVMFEYLLEKK